MQPMGHVTSNLTLATYARQMDRRDGEPKRLRALGEGGDWARVSLHATRDSLPVPEGRGRIV